MLLAITLPAEADIAVQAWDGVNKQGVDRKLRGRNYGHPGAGPQPQNLVRTQNHALRIAARINTLLRCRIEAIVAGILHRHGTAEIRARGL